MPNNTTPLNYDDLLQHLKSKNLIISDDNRTKKYLQTIGYTRFKSYFKMFCDSNGNFQNDFSFDDLLNIYIFDRRLRALFIEALERIELAVRNSIVDIVSVNTGNEYFIYDSSNFNSGYNGVLQKLEIMFGIKQIKKLI